MNSSNYHNGYHNGYPTESFKSELLCEEYLKIRHPSGLDIYIFPKDMTTTYALFGTRYGSVNNSFRIGDGPVVTVPDGIAHFLEHKLFFNEDGSDSFERFSEYGADSNAYTSFNKTAYLFSCTDHFEESFAELLEFVTHPYFTEESVASEVGIISEEIRMYNDHPGDRCFYGMLEGMYEKHSVRRNICGSAESIRQITPELLYNCYHAFYQLSNMALILCGNLDVDTVLKIADEHLPHECHRIPVETVNENKTERPEAFKSKVVRKMQVSKPIFNIGFKDTDIPEDGAERQKKDAAMSILHEMLFSRAGELYNSLFDAGLISPGFSYGYNSSESCAYHSLAGESDHPEEVLRVVRAYLDKKAKEGLSREDFERGRRVMYAEFVKGFDSTESIANTLFNFICEDGELLSYATDLENVTFEEVCRLFSSAFDEKTTTLSVVLPLDESDDKFESSKE